MALVDDLTKEVETIFKSRWEEREGRDVPDPTKLKLGNEGVSLDATILYADMAGIDEVGE